MVPGRRRRNRIQADSRRCRGQDHGKGGVESGNAIPWPETIESVDEAFAFINEQNKETYRNSDLVYPGGQWLVDQRDETTYRVTVTTGFPFTIPYARGVYKGVVKDFTGSTPTLEETETESGEAGAWVLSW